MEDLMIKVEHVSKQYRLGQIGGTTLRDELQRKRARMKGEEDPTRPIGIGVYEVGETFMALNNISLDIKKGERIGIIGNNGAGKSTLLKLISRVTAPTKGKIYLNGRVASMLEVGTGFHGELTGRENIYMNGAILGMTKKEIESKIEDIIDFSECRKFIDTPVKRYSSGMYVKLAFSVAAHLDSEIMIMDEVLAVGDVAFQKKCLDKMNEVSRNEGRTVLYVSHNMNTIRKLCNRCIELDSGKIVYDGNCEDTIQHYLSRTVHNRGVIVDLRNRTREPGLGVYAKINTLKLLDKVTPFYANTEKLQLRCEVETTTDIKNMAVRVTFYNQEYIIGTAFTNVLNELKRGEYVFIISVPLTFIPKGKFAIALGIHELNESNTYDAIDWIWNLTEIEIEQRDGNNWYVDAFGNIRIPGATLKIKN